ncbi:MAG: hypothetical protein JWM02_1955 [Frankiales bacterium]|nr:hypothetical protein [Frankiales bacterium]
MKDLPFLSVLLVVAVGVFSVGVLHSWRIGSGVVGLGLCLGAALRLTLPTRQAGLLVVRSRAVDAAVLLVLGFALVILTNTIPAGH